MLAYTKSKPHIETLRPAIDRIGDFAERERTLTEDEARLVSAWCGDCKTPSCATGHGSFAAFMNVPAFAGLPIISQGNKKTECPLGNNIPGWEAAVADGRFEDANKIARATNPWPDITGQVCPDGLCELGCLLREAGHQTDHIRKIERFIGEWSWKNSKVEPIKILGDLDASVVIIGAGPAGYPVGHDLCRLGVKVSYYDKNDVAGGLATRGLPQFKIHKGRITPYFDRLKAAGVEFNMNTAIGRDIGFAEMIDKHDADAVVIATGTYGYKAIPGLKGAGKEAVIHGISYLQTQNERDDGIISPKFVSGEHDARGKRVVIVGAGDTAFDDVGTALRQGAEKVTLLVRGTQMRAIKKEIKANLEEAQALAAQKGVDMKDVLDIRYETELEEVMGTSRQITGVVLKTKTGLEHIPADMAIAAIGSDGVDLRAAWELPGLKMTDQNLIPVTPILDPHKPVHSGGRGGRGGGLAGLFQTSSGRIVPVFAVGDIALDRNNPHDKALLVTALAHGRNTVPDILYALQHEEAMRERYECMSLNRA